MSSINRHNREVSLKIVYYGPGLGGKTTSLQYVHRTLKPESRGQLVSLSTGADRTLFFDFLPVTLPKVRGFTVRLLLYTVPGQVHYGSTRKLVLTGADAIVFVADSQRERLSANAISLQDLVENLGEQGVPVTRLPLVFQYNKMDAPTRVPRVELDALLNAKLRAPVFESVATQGTGVYEALKEVVKRSLDLVRRSLEGSAEPAGAAVAAPVSDSPSGRIPAPAAAEPSGRVRGGTGEWRLTSTPSGELAIAPERPHAAAIAVASAGASSTAAAVDGATMPVPARSLSDLLEQASHKQAVVSVERAIDRADWAGAVRQAGDAVRDLSLALAGIHADRPDEAVAVAAVLAGIPGTRFQRFRECQARIAAAGAVTSTDALFAALYLADLALRIEETRLA